MTNIDSNYSALDALSQQPQTQAKNKYSDLGADAFMELMIAQIQNQNPLEPMENGDFLAQLAQFSTTSGISDLNNSFAGLAGSMQSYQALQASSLIGREVLVNSDVGVLPQGGYLEGKVTLTASTPQLNIEVQDGSGQVVRHITMGSQGSGQVPFTWDGKADSGVTMPPGTYRVKANAFVDGRQIAMDTAMYVPVESVNLRAGSDGVELNALGLGTVTMSQVMQVR